MGGKTYTYGRCGGVALFSCSAVCSKPERSRRYNRVTISSKIDDILKATWSDLKLAEPIVSVHTSGLSGSSLKSCMRTKSSQSSAKKVSFGSIEIREYPRILGDNPSCKRGPAISLGWYNNGRKTKLSIDQFEKTRSTSSRYHRRCPVLSSRDRIRILRDEGGVTAKEILIARREISMIKRSRERSLLFQEYDDAMAAVEGCARTFTRLLQGAIFEWEVQELMKQAEKTKGHRQTQ